MLRNEALIEKLHHVFAISHTQTHMKCHNGSIFITTRIWRGNRPFASQEENQLYKDKLLNKKLSRLNNEIT